MQFTRRLHDGIRAGKITCSVRIWQKPRVKVGGRYKLGEGEIEIESLRRITLRDITPELARRSGFDGVVALMKTAKHGRGEQVFLVEFRHLPARSAGKKSTRSRTRKSSKTSGGRERQRRERLVKICEALPEVGVTVGGDHLGFRVRKKSFAYYLNDHHGDGRIALCCKSTRQEQAALVEWDPERFYVPPYVGKSGWIALRLDGRSVDWEQVSELVLDAYRLQAPRSLAAGL